jgi:hypothetical protein
MEKIEAYKIKGNKKYLVIENFDKADRFETIGKLRKLVKDNLIMPTDPTDIGIFILDNYLEIENIINEYETNQLNKGF